MPVMNVRQLSNTAAYSSIHIAVHSSLLTGMPTKCRKGISLKINYL